MFWWYRACSYFRFILTICYSGFSLFVKLIMYITDIYGIASFIFIVLLSEIFWTFFN